MIFSAGLSPAWQQIVQLDKLSYGEVNRACTVQRCASGKVLNVALAATALGESTAVLTALGGAAGQEIQQELVASGMHADIIETETATRLCTTLIDADGTATEIVENCSALTQQDLDEFVERFRIQSQVADVTVFTGSLPQGVPPEYYSRLLYELPVRMIVDVQGPAVMACLSYGPFLLKPNREELQRTVDRELSSAGELVEAMQELNERGARWVLVSDGPRELWLTSSETAWRFVPPRVQVVNPIGSGDCLAAGIASKLQSRSAVTVEQMLQAVRFGIAAAAHNAEMLLPARLKRERVEELCEQVEMEARA